MLSKKIHMPVIMLMVSIVLVTYGFSFVSRESDSVYITDLRGEQWEITQAVSLGFKPERFDHGIGKHAFKPLDDSDFEKNDLNISPGKRVIGLANDAEAQAIGVSKLARHEIANTTLGDVPIAIGY